MRPWKLLKQKTFFYVFILFLSSQLWAAGVELPPLETDEQKLAFLLEAKNRVPALFSNAAKYDIDLFALLDDENHLFKILKSNSEYNQLFSNKKYFKLSIIPPPEGIPVGRVEIKEEAIESWKEELTQSLNELNQHIPSLNRPDQLLSKLREVKKEYEELIFGKNLDFKQQFGKIGAKPKIPEQNLTHEELNRFKEAQKRLNRLLQQNKGKDWVQRYQLILDHYDSLIALPNLPQKERLKKTLHILNTENQLQALLQLWMIASQSPEQEPKDWSGLRERIQTLSEQDLIFYHDKQDTLMPKIKKALQSGVLEQRLVDGIFRKIDTFASQTMRTQDKAKHPIQITQVPPSIGIFRGCTGGDCSTQYSFPYPNDPYEMVFFITDFNSDLETNPSVNLKGYVSATHVLMSNGDPALYVITISGNRVSAGDVELILRALEKEKKNLGVKHILLPETTKLSDLINFPSILGVYETHTKNKSPVSFSYQNPEIRKEIEEFKSSLDYNIGTYDHMKDNTQGVVLTFKDLLSKKIEIHLDHQISGDAPKPKEISQYPLSEILEFVIDLHHSKRDQLTQKILRLLEVQRNINPEVLTRLFHLLDSCTIAGNKDELLSVQEYKKKLESELAKLQIGLQLFTKHSNFLYPGIVHCKNAFSEENREQTALWITEDIMNHSEDYYKPSKINPDFITSNSDALNKTAAIKKFSLKLIKLLEDPTWSVRYKAVYGLALIKPTNPEALNEIEKLLETQHWQTRILAATVLVETQPTNPKLHKALTELLADQKKDVRRAAAAVLKKLETWK